jgi:hypothetical protein
MTITRPFLLIILHFSHIAFTDGLTFTAFAPFRNSKIARGPAAQKSRAGARKR